MVDHDRVVHHQIHRHQGLDALGVTPHPLGHIAHRGEIGQERHTREVLQHHACNDERDLLGPGGVGLPVREFLDMLLGDFLAIDIAQHGLQHDPHRYRQPADIGEGLGQGGQ